MLYSCGRIVDEDILHSSHLPECPSLLTPTTPIQELFNEEDICARFSDMNGVVDLTEPELPTVKKRKLTAYFKPVSTSTNQMPYFYRDVIHNQEAHDVMRQQLTCLTTCFRRFRIFQICIQSKLQINNKRESKAKRGQQDIFHC